MNTMFLANIRTFVPDLIEYAREWKIWRAKQKAKRSAEGAIAAILKY